MWTAPSSQEVVQRFDQIACVHMSGLLMRSHMNAGQDGFRDNEFQTVVRPLRGHWVYRSVTLSWIDRSHHLLIFLQVLASAQHGCSLIAPRVWPISMRRLRTSRTVSFPRHHHLPGDARGFVGQRYGSQLRRLALEQSTAKVTALPLRRACWITAVAPATSTLRNASSPARVIAPSLTLPAVE